jgi:hypothetical protein
VLAAPSLRVYIHERIKRLYFGENCILGARVEKSIERRAGGMLLWATLALDMLKDGRIAVDVEHFVQRVPQGMNAMIEYDLNMHGATDTDDRNHELEYIPISARNSSMPLALSELYSMLTRSAYDGDGFYGKGMRVRDDYGSLSTVSRDERITTTMLRHRDRGYNSISEATKVAFALASIGEYIGNHQQFACDARPGMAKLREDVLCIEASNTGDRTRSRDTHDLQATFENLRSLYLLDNEACWNDIMTVINGLLPSAGFSSLLLLELIL